MPKKKIAISIDENLLEVIDNQRGNEKRSTYINSIVSNHFRVASEEKGGGTLVTTLELRKTLKPIYNKLLVLEGLTNDVKALQELLKAK
jgi:metal-responsive CopG/Arc/MetJ family transcriptional regulator